MPFFLVHTTVTLPAGDVAGLAERREAEVQRARELQDEGTIVALWREAGKLASYGIWRGDDGDHVRALIASLPMSRYMAIEVTELHPHPNATSSYLLEAEGLG